MQGRQSPSRMGLWYRLKTCCRRLPSHRSGRLGASWEPVWKATKQEVIGCERSWWKRHEVTFHEVKALTFHRSLAPRLGYDSLTQTWLRRHHSVDFPWRPPLQRRFSLVAGHHGISTRPVCLQCVAVRLKTSPTTRLTFQTGRWKKTERKRLFACRVYQRLNRRMERERKGRKRKKEGYL